MKVMSMPNTKQTFADKMNDIFAFVEYWNQITFSQRQPHRFDRDTEKFLHFYSIEGYKDYFTSKYITNKDSIQFRQITDNCEVFCYYELRIYHHAVDTFIKRDVAAKGLVKKTVSKCVYCFDEISSRKIINFEKVVNPNNWQPDIVFLYNLKRAYENVDVEIPLLSFNELVKRGYIDYNLI